MKTLLCRFTLTFVFVLQVALVRAGELATAAETYEQRVATTLRTLPDDTDPIIRRYLESCLANVAGLNGIKDDAPNVSAVLSDVAQSRRAAFGKLLTGMSRHPAVQAETVAYNDTVQPLSADNFLAWVTLQNQLLEQKYFNTKTAKTGNFIEGYLNGQWGLTRADPSRLRERNPPRPLGVSPWEAIARFEPTLALHQGGEVAIMATGGLSYTFFPGISDGTPPTFVPNFRSTWVKKSGVRGGVGAMKFDSKTRMLLGSGIQLNALGIWALYEPKQKIWMLGLSTADLSKVKKAFGWFD